MEAALQSIYDYADKIKSFVEEDYVKEEPEKRLKDEQHSKLHGSENVVCNISNGVLEQVEECWPGQRRTDRENAGNIPLFYPNETTRMEDRADDNVKIVNETNSEEKGHQNPLEEQAYEVDATGKPFDHEQATAPPKDDARQTEASMSLQNSGELGILTSDISVVEERASSLENALCTTLPDEHDSELYEINNLEAEFTGQFGYKVNFENNHRGGTESQSGGIPSFPTCKEDYEEIKQKRENVEEQKQSVDNDCIMGGCKGHLTFQKDNVSSSRIPMKNVDDMDPDTVCGIGRFRPQWLQQWATPRAYLILFSVVGVLQGSYYTYLTSVLTTLEKRYAFENKISGVVMMVDEITPLFLGVLVGYFGGKAHRPRVVALGMFLSALCCFLSALPYFMYGTAKHFMSSAVTNGTNTEYCLIDRPRTEHCQEDDRPPTVTAVAFLLVGSFLKGFGSLAYYAVGVSYLDDSAKKTNTPIYLTIATAFRLLGPTLGFLMSSAFLRMYENPFDDPGFDTEDPRWIGAWWMGFMLQGVLLCIFSFPIMLFPRRLPRQRQRTPSNTANFDQETMYETAAGMFKALKRLLLNPLYILYSMATLFTILGGLGIFSMMPKYMEHQFRISASHASLLSGPPNIAAIQVSSIIGGIIIWKWKPNAKKLITAIIFTGMVDVASYTLMMIPTCPQLNMAGTKTVNSEVILDNACNTNCNCTLKVFTPVCGPDGVSTYFSPCHAGCVSHDSSDLDTFFNCSCVVDSDGNFTFANSVSRGYCPNEQCWTQAILYMVIMISTALLASLARVAYTLILFRSVEPADKSVALGTFETLICGLAFLPYPLVYTSLADNACLIWESSCGETGNCWLYDTSALKYHLHGISAAFSCLAVLFSLCMYTFADRVRDIYQEDDEYLEMEELKKKATASHALETKDVENVENVKKFNSDKLKL